MRARSLTVAALLLGAAALSAGCSKVQEKRAYVRGMQSYVYGFPLVMMDVTREVLTAAPRSGELKAPINQFARIRTTVGPDVKDVVRISVNSLWSHGFLDVGQEPMVVTIPDTRGRYLVMQALNMWTDDFASVGTRTPETNAGNYLIAGPGWTGTPPADVKKVFQCSTRYAWVLVQMAVAGPQEYPEVHALQDQLRITPLSAWGKPYTPPTDVPVDSSADVTATPFDRVRIMTGEMFFRRLAAALKDSPPYPGDGDAISHLRKIGLEPGKDFDPARFDRSALEGLDAVPGQIWLKLAEGAYQQPTVNGWINMLNLGQFGTDYQTRAFIAWAGLGALTKADAIYPSAFVDGDGKVLDGAQKYVIHFPKDGLPPSGSDVWSVSVYRENFYVENPLRRYGITSKMPLQYNADGSLDVYLQAESPGKDRESNWLPTPRTGPINLTVRIYEPKKEALDGTYKLPPVKRVGDIATAAR